MLVVVSRRTDIGNEGHPLCRFGRGAKEAGRRLPEKYRRRALRHSLSVYVESKQGTQRSTQVQAARRLTALLLHVWIDGGIMVWLQWSPGEVPGKGFGERKKIGQILARRRSPPFSPLP